MRAAPALRRPLRRCRVAGRRRGRLRSTSYCSSGPVGARHGFAPGKGFCGGVKVGEANGAIVIAIHGVKEQRCAALEPEFGRPRGEHFAVHLAALIFLDTRPGEVRLGFESAGGRGRGGGSERVCNLQSADCTQAPPQRGRVHERTTKAHGTNLQAVEEVDGASLLLLQRGHELFASCVPWQRAGAYK